MTVKSVISGTDPEVQKISFQEGSVFFVRIVYLAVFCLELEKLVPGMLLDETAYEAFSRAVACSRAESIVLNLLARQEQSQAGLTGKLRRRAFDDEVIEQVLNRLTRIGLVDDQRYARAWLNSRLASAAEGRYALLAGLRRRGIARSTAEAAVTELVKPEAEALLLERYLSRLAASSRPARNLHQLVRRRGFSSACIKARWGSAVLDLADSEGKL